MSRAWTRLVTIGALSCALTAGPSWADGGGQDPPDGHGGVTTGGGTSSETIDLLLDAWSLFVGVLSL